MESIEWTEIKFRKPTEEEREDLDLDDDDYARIFDCKLPEDDQVCLLTVNSVRDVCVAVDTFCSDVDGPWFEDWDWDDIIAWAPLPEPFKP